MSQNELKTINVIRKGFWAVLGQLSVSGMNFLAGWSIAYFSTKVEYGLYVLAYSLVYFWGGFRHSFCGMPMMVYLPRQDRENSGPYLGTTLIIALLIDGICVLLFMAGGVIIALSGNRELSYAIYASIFSMFGMSSRQHVRQTFYARLRIRIASIIDFTSLGLSIVSIICLYFAESLTAVNILIFIGLSQITVTIIGLIVLFSEGSIIFRNLCIGKIIPINWNFGKWLALTNISATIAIWSYPWFLKYIDGIESAAIFGACMYPLRFLAPVVLGISNLVTPMYAHVYVNQGLKGVRKYAGRSMIIISLIMGAFTIGFIVFSKNIIHLLYNGKYDDYHNVLAVVSITILLTGVTLPLKDIFSVTENTRLFFIINIFGAITTLSIGMLLSYVMSIPGAALATVLTHIIILILYFLLQARLPSKSGRHSRRCSTIDNSSEAIDIKNDTIPR